MSFTFDGRAWGLAAEAAVVTERLADVGRDRGRVVLISGPSGSGKTSLLDVAAEQAHGAGFRVLRTAGGPLARHTEFGAVRRIFRTSSVDAAGRRAMTDAIRFTRSHTEVAVAYGEARWAGIPIEVLHSLYRSMATLAAVQPVALVVDDLHQVDLSSVRWLVHLARRVAGLPVVVFATVADDVDNPADTLLAELGAAPRCQVLRLAPLGPEAATTMVARHLEAEPAAEFTAVCHEVSGGNPLVLRETLRALANRSVPPLPDRVDLAREVGVRARCKWVLDVLRAQAGPVVLLARVIAVLGDDADLSVVAEVGSAELTATRRAAAVLGRVGVLVPGTLEFTHPAMAETIARDTTSSQLVRLHQRAARSLSDRGAPVDVVAAHLLAAGPPEQPEMVTVLREASSTAVERGAPDLAMSYLRHALTGRWEPDLRITLLGALTLVERSADPKSAWEHLVEALRMMDSPLRRARAAISLFPLPTGSAAATLVDVLEDCLERLGPVAGTEPEVDELRTRLFAHTICVAVGDRDVMARLRPRVDALDEDSLGGTPGQCALLAIKVFFAAMEGERDAASAVESVTRAMRGDLLLRDDMLHPMFMSALAVLQVAERFDLVAPLYDIGIAEAKARNLPMVHAMLCGARSALRFHGGDVPGALADARAASEAHSAGYRGDNQPLTVAAAVACLGELGRWDEAADLLDTDFSPAAERSYRWCSVLAARAWVFEGRGDLRSALDHLLECGRRLSWWNIHSEVYLPWRGRAALLHHRLGNTAEARRLAGEALDSAQRWGTDGAIGSALRALGVVEGGVRGIALLRRAVVHGERSAARLELAKTLIELGCAQHAADDHEVARRTLRRGLDLATQCGAAVVAARARTELIAAGGRPRRNRLHGTNALTPAESQVVRFAARGISNDEIAQALFVTQRTVEFHLTNSYRKLGLTERSQLTDVVEPDDPR